MDTPTLTHEIEQEPARDWDRVAGASRGTPGECVVLEAKGKAMLDNLNSLLAYRNILSIFLSIKLVIIEHSVC